jgi:glycosyltransferase involved in cell wall biosynthesis
MFAPLHDRFDLTGIASRRSNFDLGTMPFPVVRLPSIGQAVRSRHVRSVMDRLLGDHHDLLGLRATLRGSDIVHAAESSSYYTAQAARLKQELGYRLVVTVWENIPFQLDHPATRRIKDEVFERTDRFFAVTSRARETLLLEGAPPDRVHVLMPGIDIDHFVPLPRDVSLQRSFGLTPDDLVVLYVAHLTRQKGIYDLCAAMHAVLAGNLGIPIRLVIAGKGPEESGVREFVQRLGIDSHVRMIGSHPYRDMPAIHGLADIFVLASQPTATWQEQFGYVLAESMACGRAVVGTMSGSIPEVVGDAGVLVPPSDFHALAGALAALAVDPLRRRDLGIRARQRAVEQFDRRAVALRIRSHYETLLGHAAT